MLQVELVSDDFTHAGKIGLKRSFPTLRYCIQWFYHVLLHLSVLMSAVSHLGRYREFSNHMEFQ